MENYFSFLKKPIDSNITAWFSSIADILLNKTDLIIAGKTNNIQEIEFYYNAKDHRDPFAHCNPIQKSYAKWYLHKKGTSYSSGSFKGLDITFGPENAFGGILIRTILTSDNNIINGPSLIVDYILNQTGLNNLNQFGKLIETYSIWDHSNPIYIKPHKGTDTKCIISTARVGLTLKRVSDNPEMPDYIMRPYRYLNNFKIKKGIQYTIISLHQKGYSPDEIKSKTNCSISSINNYISRQTS